MPQMRTPAEHRGRLQALFPMPGRALAQPRRPTDRLGLPPLRTCQRPLGVVLLHARPGRHLRPDLNPSDAMTTRYQRMFAATARAAILWMSFAITGAFASLALAALSHPWLSGGSAILSALSLLAALAFADAALTIRHRDRATRRHPSNL